MSKDQVYALIGRQHLVEGFNHNIGNEWDYLFNFRKAGGRAFQTCQYKVMFDEKDAAKSIHWNPVSCANWLNYEPEVAAVPPEVLVKPGPERISYIFSADGFFAFDKSSITDLEAGGVQKLKRVVADIQKYGDLVHLKVTGHTDRLGSKEHNEALSNARASTIKIFLTKAGILADLIETEGVANARPLVECPQGKRDDNLIRCLAPNRRFEIEVLVTKAAAGQ